MDEREAFGRPTRPWSFRRARSTLNGRKEGRRRCARSRMSMATDTASTARSNARTSGSSGTEFGRPVAASGGSGEGAGHTAHRCL